MNGTKFSGLSGKTFLVTGASSGIGLATAKLIAACGAHVVLSGRDEGRLVSAMRQLSGQGHLVRPCTLENADDVHDWVTSLVGEVGAFGGAFHCAGVELIRPMRMVKQANLDNILGSSLFAAFGIARALCRRGALVDGGSLVIMSSVSGQTGQIGMTAYSAAKSALDGMVRSLACELAPRRIRANSVAAGAVLTEMHGRLSKSLGDDSLAAYESAHLLGIGEPDDVAAAVVFLLSDASKWITGTTLVVDGGYMVR